MELQCLDTLEFRSDCTLDILVAKSENRVLGILYAYVFNGYVKVFRTIQDFYEWKFNEKDVDYLEITHDEYNSDFMDKHIIERFLG